MSSAGHGGTVRTLSYIGAQQPHLTEGPLSGIVLITRAEEETTGWCALALLFFAPTHSPWTRTDHGQALSVRRLRRWIIRLVLLPVSQIYANSVLLMYC